MATIVRGISFDPNGIASAAALNQLVSAAQITGITSSDFSNADGIITVGTAPTDTMQVGALATLYEAPFTSSNPSWSEFNYLLKTTEGLVALFKPLGLETRRFFHSSTADVPGSAMTFQVSGQGATLRCARSYTDQVNPRHLFLGACHETASSSASNHMDRLVLKGVCTARVVAGASSGQLNRRYFAADNNQSTGAWASSGATNTHQPAGMALDIQVASDARVVGYLFGAPLYRT